VGLDELLILFIAPPWGNAFDKTSGVDLRRTTPPIIEIVDFLLHRFSQNHLLCAIQVYEVVLPVSMTRVICCKPAERFDDYKLAYYINMEHPIQADQYDLNSREAMVGVDFQAVHVADDQQWWVALVKARCHPRCEF
jgi:hypothetical protein